MGTKIIVLSFSGIGNSLMAVPFLNCLRRKTAPLVIDALCLNRGIADILKLASACDNCFILGPGLLGVMRVLWRLRPV